MGKKKTALQPDQHTSKNDAGDQAQTCANNSGQAPDQELCSRSDYISKMLTPLAVWALALYVYGSTAQRGVVGGDSGELMAMACAGGVAHPPGYPLLTVLGRAWLSLCPSTLGTPAYRLSLLSVLLGSSSAGILSAAAGIVSGVWEGAIMAGIFAFSPVIWKHSQQFEVFALNNLLISLLLLLFLLSTHHSTPWARSWAPACGALVCGLGVSNQHTIVLLEAPLIISLLILHRHRLLDPVYMSALALLFILGCCPYAYLPYAGAKPPIGSWGDLGSAKGFWRHVTRQEYGTFQLYTTGSEAGDTKAHSGTSRLGMFARLTQRYVLASSQESLYLGPPLALVGSLWLAKQHLDLALTLVASVCIYVGVFHTMANLPDDEFYHPILERFWMQPQQVILLLSACGLRAVSQSTMGRGGRFGWVGAAVCVGVVCVQIGRYWDRRNVRRNDIVDTFARQLLAAMPKDSIALCTGDLNYYPLLYLQHCEGMRRDVLPVNTAMIKGEWFTAKQASNYPNVSFPGRVYAPGAGLCDSNAYDLACFLKANILGEGPKRTGVRRRRFVLARKYPPEDESPRSKGYTEWPLGLVREIVPRVSGAAPTGKGKKGHHWRGGRAFPSWLNQSLAALPHLGRYVLLMQHVHNSSAEAMVAGREAWQAQSWCGDEKEGPECSGLDPYAWAHAPRAEDWEGCCLGELDNWDRVVVSEYLLAHTALSKFVISSLRDEHKMLGIPSNHTLLANAGVRLAQGLFALLHGEPLPAKNLGALFQHLMNHSPDEEHRIRHMSRMVHAYNTFVTSSKAKGEADPDQRILGDWVAKVEEWMQDNGYGAELIS